MPDSLPSRSPHTSGSWILAPGSCPKELFAGMLRYPLEGKRATEEALPQTRGSASPTARIHRRLVRHHHFPAVRHLGDRAALRDSFALDGRYAAHRRPRARRQDGLRALRPDFETLLAL